MTAPALHPISLESVVFTKSIVQAIQDHEPVEGGRIAPPENLIRIEKLEDEEGAYAATMTTIVNKAMDKQSPYFIEMECMALLRADKTLTEEEAQRGIAITAHTVLFGAIRESVAWLTARQPYGPITLGLSVLRSRPREEQQPAETPASEKK
jgi:hypothetical protein